MLKGNKRLVIITACLDDWGGSEELWAKSILYLKKEGIEQITLYKNRVNIDNEQFKNLLADGLKYREFDNSSSNYFKLIASKSKHVLGRIADKLGLAEFS